jgi:hypothetical protein
MSLTVILLLSPNGDDDPTWTLTPDQEAEFHHRLAACPIPPVTVGSGGQHPGYAGLMVRAGDGERWTIFRTWIRGGLNTRTDERRVLEQWLLDTGKDAVPPKLLADLTNHITPPV